jgi:DNA polymerase III subunit epsilon
MHVVPGPEGRGMELKKVAADSQLHLQLRHAEADVFPPLALVQPPSVPTSVGVAGSVSPGSSLTELSFMVVDVETTGGRAWFGDRVTEIAAVSVRGGKVGECFDSLVNPGRRIPPFITRLTTITNSMVADAPTFRSICSTVLGLLQGSVFVAHNARFDWSFVTMEVERTTGERPTAASLCTVRLARVLLPQLRRRSLDAVAHHFGITIGARHRAAGDALATAHVLTRLMEEAGERGCVTWGDLSALLYPGRRKGGRKRTALPHPTVDDSIA